MIVRTGSLIMCCAPDFGVVVTVGPLVVRSWTVPLPGLLVVAVEMEGFPEPTAILELEMGARC
jgi:hypothetical protein